jgi:hypothetical protein
MISSWLDDSFGLLYLRDVDTNALIVPLMGKGEAPG